MPRINLAPLKSCDTPKPATPLSAPRVLPSQNKLLRNCQPLVSNFIQRALVFASFLLLTFAGSALLLVQLPTWQLWDIKYMAKLRNSSPKLRLAYAIIFGCVMALKAANLGLTFVEWYLKRFPTNLVIGNALLLTAIFVGLVKSMLSGEDSDLLLILLILFELPKMPFLAIECAFSAVFVSRKEKRVATIVPSHFVFSLDVLHIFLKCLKRE